MLRNIKFSGHFKDKLSDITLDADTPEMVLRGLKSQVADFNSVMKEQEKYYFIVKGGEDQIECLTPESFKFSLPIWADEIYLVPEVEGDWEAATYVAAMAFEAGTVAYYVAAVVVYIAIAYAISSVAMALAPTPGTAGGSERADERPSFLYNGPVNVIEQGYAVPIVYGIHMTGSVVISAGVDVDEVAYTPTYSSGGSPSKMDYQWGSGAGDYDTGYR